MNSANFTNKTILLVEDEVITAMAEARQIERLGYAVIKSSSGEDAIRIIGSRQVTIDLILMDIDLGSGIDGTEAADEILKSNDIPILFLSSHTEEHIVAKTENITSYGYVVKNTGITVLAASIKMAFKLHEANRQLRITSENFTKVFHSTPDAMIISRKSDGMIREINETFSLFTGFKREDVIGKYALSDDINLWVHAEERNTLLIKLEKEGHIDGAEIQFRKKDGSVKMFQISASLITYNEEMCVIYAARDITERKRAEERLNATFRRMHDIIEFLPDPAFVIDHDGKVIYWNREMEHLTGVKKEEILGQGDYAYALPFYHERRPILIDMVNMQEAEFEGKYANAKRVGNRIYGELYFSHLNGGAGAYCWGAAGPLFDSSGLQAGAIEILRDINARKESERMLRESEERFSKAFRSSPAAMMISDITTGYILEANEQWTTLLGYEREEMIGHTTRDLMLFPDWADRERVVGEVRLAGFVREAPVHAVTKSGEIRDVLWSVELIKQRGYAFMLSVVYDITARNRAESALHALLDEKTTLLKELHHRVKNNMQLIISLLNLQADRLHDADARAALTNSIQRIYSMAHIHEKIYQSEDMSRIDFHVYMQELVNEIVATYIADPENIDLTMELHDVQLTLNEAVPCGLLINELLTNSIKHGCSEFTPGRIQLSFFPVGNSYILLVRDEGPGIPDAVIADTRKTLGMQLITSLCRQLNADISIERDQGTCFRITIPRHT